MCYSNRMLDSTNLSNMNHPEEELLVQLWKNKAAFDALQTTTNPFAIPGLGEDRLSLRDWGKVPLCFIHANSYEEPVNDAGYTEGLPLIKVPAVAADGMLVTVMDPANKLLGGYRLVNPHYSRLPMYFDSLLWDDLGHPVDGRALFLQEPLKSAPFVLTEDALLLCCDEETEVQPEIFFANEKAKSQMQLAFEPDFLSIQRRSCSIPAASLEILAAVKAKEETKNFSLSDLQDILDSFKEQIIRQDNPDTPDLYRFESDFAVPLYGFVRNPDQLAFCAVVPGQDIVYNKAYSLDMRWDNICLACRSTKESRYFLLKHTERSIASALHLFEEAAGLQGQKMLSVTSTQTIAYLGRHWGYSVPKEQWFSRRYSRLAAMLIKFRKPPCSLDSPNAHLLCDAEIGQWLPADFKVTRKNINGVLSFIHGVLNDLRDLDVPMVASLFQEDFSEEHVKAFKTVCDTLQLSDLEQDGFFLYGCLFAARYSNTLWAGHRAVRNMLWADRALVDMPWDDFSLPPADWSLLPFACKEDFHIDGYIFSSVKQPAQYYQARCYCGLSDSYWFDSYHRRVSAAIISREESPRVPLGVVHPPGLPGGKQFELSQEFYEFSEATKAQQDAAFAQVVESYLTILDEKYLGAC